MDVGFFELAIALACVMGVFLLFVAIIWFFSRKRGRSVNEDYNDYSGVQ